MNTLIKVQGISKKYKDKVAINDLSFEIKRGEILGIIGHNGAGKSTLINSLSKITAIDSGTIDYIFDEKTLYDHIGVQRQENHFEFNSKVYEVCYLYKKIRKSNIDIDQALSEFGLKPYRNDFISQLSGGNKQMLNILLAVLHEPEIIFLDELTTGLDPFNRRIIWDYLKDLNQKREMTVVLTSHSMEEIEYLSDRLMILNEGKKTFLGGIEEAIRKYSGGEKNIIFTLKDTHHAFKLMKHGAIHLGEKRYRIRTTQEEEVILFLYNEVGVEALKVENLTLEDVFLKLAGYVIDEMGQKQGSKKTPQPLLGTF